MSKKATKPAAKQPTIEEKAQEIVVRTRQMTVTNNAQYEAAAEHLKVIKGLLAEVDETFDSVIAAAHTAHKEALNQKKKHAQPLLSAETMIKGLISGYVRLVELKRLADEKRLRDEEEQRVKAQIEADRTAKVEELVAFGDFEAADKVLSEPVTIAPGTIAPFKLASSLPKVEGLSTRKLYEAEVFDFTALVAAGITETLEPCMTFLNRQASAFKQAGKVLYPGVRIIEKDSVASGK